MMMGYSQQQVITALQQNRDDINRAVEFLLTQNPVPDDSNFIRLDGFNALPEQKPQEFRPSEEDRIAFIQANFIKPEVSEFQELEFPKQSMREEKARKIPEADTLDNLKRTVK